MSTSSSSSSGTTPSSSSSDSSGSSSSTSSSPTLPQVLTTSSIIQLTSGFDASDALECYLLVRDAYLHGLANSTIPVHKLALGIRYRPPNNYYSNHGPKKSLELTLEYGPQRDGPSLTHEVVPTLVAVDEDEAKQGNPTTTDDDTTSKQSHPQQQELQKVLWDNEARVYYTLRIGGYRSANYVASMTGAVLKNLLQVAVSYPTASHRRYQPFSVYYTTSSSSTSTEEGGSTSETTTISSSEKLLLRSSSDLDFVAALWQHLTDVGVELKPVILPPRWRIRLSAAGIRRFPPRLSTPSDQSSSSSTNEMSMWIDQERHRITDFYAHLYQCIEAIATANYSAYDDPTTASSLNSTSSSNNDRTSGSGGPSRQLRRLTTDTTIQSEEETTKRALQETTIHDPTTSPSDSSQVEPLEVEVTLGDSSASATENSGQQQDPSNQDTEDPEPPPPLPPPTTTADTDQVAQDAANAAKDAETAAQEAQSSGNTQAAQAAQAAADAAKKAADSTRGQAALVAQKALLSGDGAAVAEALSQCLSSPRYGIGRNDSNTTTVYLYWDGSVYYAINLTAPYIQVVAESSHLPRPPQLNLLEGGRGDVVDWTIALIVLTVFVFGLLCLLQKVLGRKVQVIRPLYRFQRWYFDPVHYSLDDAMDVSEQAQRGKGHKYTFAEDVIPLSMGGKMSWGSDYYHVGSSSHDDEEDHSEELELVASSSRRRTKGSSADKFADDLGDGPPSDPSRELSPALRFLRNPDFVALPDLKSTSKVAVPVSHYASHHSRSDDTDNSES